MIQKILSHLSQDYPWTSLIQYFPTVSSTNDILKVLARQGVPQGTVVIAGHQTGGHGRMGRSFHSPEGQGVYLSILLRPSCSPMALMHLTCAAAVAMCDAVEAASGLRPAIKWTNDLVYQKRKLGGILTEMGLSPQGMVDYAIIGIGINCCQQPEDFPEEIRGIAASVDMVTGKRNDPAVLAAAMLEALSGMNTVLLSGKHPILQAYRQNCVTIGQEISLLRGDSLRHGTALEVDESGALVVRYDDGTEEAVNSGEVSIRGMYGYL